MLVVLVEACTFSDLRDGQYMRHDRRDLTGSSPSNSYSVPGNGKQRFIPKTSIRRRVGEA